MVPSSGSGAVIRVQRAAGSVAVRAARRASASRREMDMTTNYRGAASLGPEDDDAALRVAALEAHRARFLGWVHLDRLDVGRRKRCGGGFAGSEIDRWAGVRIPFEAVDEECRRAIGGRDHRRVHRDRTARRAASTAGAARRDGDAVGANDDVGDVGRLLLIEIVGAVAGDGFRLAALSESVPVPGVAVDAVALRRDDL